MPYLNEAKVIGSMAMEPELTMLHNGIPYCYFAIRMVQRTPDGEISEDYLRIIVYGDVAVKVVRDYHMGDLVFCEGRLSPKQWRNAAGREEYEVHFVAEKTERLAMGDGMLPPVTIEEAANAKAAAFRMKEDTYIHSDTYRFRGAKDPNPPKLFSPQPNPNGTWHIPDNYLKQEALSWVEKEQERRRQKLAKYGYGDPAEHKPAANMTEAERIAAMLVSWTMPRTEDGQWAVLPNGKTIPLNEYHDILKRQDAMLAKQSSEALVAIMDMARKRGVVFPQDIKVEQPQQKEENENPPSETQPAQQQQQVKPIVVGSSDPKAYFKD